MTFTRTELRFDGEAVRSYLRANKIKRRILYDYVYGIHDYISEWTVEDCIRGSGRITPISETIIDFLNKFEKEKIK